MNQHSKLAPRLPIGLIALDILGVALLAAGLLIEFSLPDLHALKKLALPLMVCGGMIVAFAAVLIVRSLLSQRNR